MTERNASSTCGAHHEPATERPPVTNQEWDKWVTADIATRRDRTIAEALDSETPNAAKEVPS